jgi:fructose-1,6-bisphosphatase/inositol monophosphatase family enzyme
MRVFGEEANKYLGNKKSLIGVRIDPVDGTQEMKFGDLHWGIIAGVYAGTPENERQVLGATFYPELESLLIYVENIGVFVEDLKLGQIRKIDKVEMQNSLENILVEISSHPDPSKQDGIWEVKQALHNKGARVKIGGSSSDPLAALINNGRRALIITGSFNQVDYPPSSYLKQVGYEMYHWDGTLADPDDINIAYKRLVVVPPGEAGKEILRVVKEFAI